MRRAAVKQRWTPNGPRPDPTATLTPTGAEHLAAAWMSYLSAQDVTVSQATRDGGVDVRARGFVAQVKLQTSAVSPAAVHQIVGVANVARAVPLFFAGTSGYSKDSLRFAEQAGLAAFVYDHNAGALSAHTRAAQRALEEGLSSLRRQ